MPPFDVRERSISELQAALTSGRCSSQALIEAYTRRIAAHDRHGHGLNAIVGINPHAKQAAIELDEARRQGAVLGPLHGIPILIKDNIGTSDQPTSGGSKALAGLHTHSDAQVVQRLRAAGAIILGKTTLHELAAGLTNASSLTGYTRNPYDLRYIPGGSSGGSAAAVAASYAAAALGTDTSGSIRVPAACQNLYGLRPTFGLIDCEGLIPLCPSQDVVGPIARTVTDLAILLDVMTAPIPRGSAARRGATTGTPRFYHDGLHATSMDGLRIGVPSAMFGHSREEQENSRIVENALEEMCKLGATLVPLELVETDEKIRSSSMIAHEFKFALAGFLARQPSAPVRSLDEILARGMHHPEVDALLRLRNATPAWNTPAHTQAAGQRLLLRRDFERIMETHRLGAIAYPTLRSGPMRIGEHQPGQNCGLSPALGWPALSMPAGFKQNGLPVGMDFLGPPHSEGKLLAYAYHWETSGARRRAPDQDPD